MINRDSDRRIAAVKHYLEHRPRTSLRKTAALFGMNYRVLYDWVKSYREKGEQDFCLSSHRPRNRLPRDRELEIMMLKENKPDLTVRAARGILQKNYAAKVSLKGIHNVWQRFGLTRRTRAEPFTTCGPSTPHNLAVVEWARKTLERGIDPGTLKLVSRRINDLDSYPEGSTEDVLFKLPVKLLSPRRRLDRANAFFYHAPRPKFLAEIRKARRVLETNGFRFSSIIAGMIEASVMSFVGNPRDVIRLNSRVLKLKGRLYDPVLSFCIAYRFAFAYCQLLDVQKTARYAAQCRRLLAVLDHALYYHYYGHLLNLLGDYPRAVACQQKALGMNTDKNLTLQMRASLAINCAYTGEYHRAISVLTKAGLEKFSTSEGPILFCRVCHSLVSGEAEKTLALIDRLIDLARTQKNQNLMAVASLNLAALSYALGEKKSSHQALARFLPILKKNHYYRELKIIKFLLGRTRIDRRSQKLPLFRLLFLLDRANTTLRPGAYRRAINYARRKSLFGFLHRHMMFFPDIVLKVVRRGEKSALPESILRYPVFNIERPQYKICFLGDFRVTQNNRRIFSDFTNKQQSLLAMIAVAIGAPGKSIAAEKIGCNFWPRNRNPSARLAAALRAIRIKIKLPAHLIAIRQIGGVRQLVNNGFFMTTDYDDLRRALMEVKTLAVGQSWKSANTLFLDTLRLIRGAPFVRNYDEWSVQKRFEILSRIESEITGFLRSSPSILNGARARARLDDVLRRLPFSGGLNSLVKRTG